MAARARPAGWAGRDRLQPRPGPLPGRRDARGPARPSSSRRRGAGEGLSGGAAAVRGRTRRSTAGSGTRAGRTRSPRWPARPTPWPAPTSTSRSPSRPGSSGCSPRRARRSSGWSAWSPPWSRPATPPWSSPARRCPLPAVELAEVLATSDLPGGVVNILTGRTAELAPVLAAHRDVDALDLAGAPAELEAELEAAAADNVKRVLRRARRRARLDRTEPTPGPDALFRRDQDRLAPRRRLNARPARPRGARSCGICMVVDHPLANALLAALRDRIDAAAAVPLARQAARARALPGGDRAVPTEPVEVETPIKHDDRAADRHDPRRRARAAGRARHARGGDGALPRGDRRLHRPRA